MAIQSINVGNIANDGTGDDLREAFIKVNSNFLEVDSRLSTSSVDGVNLGVTGEGVYAGVNDTTLQFKSLLPGTNVSLISNGNSITINAAGGMENLLVLSDNGSIFVSNGVGLGIAGGNGTSTRVSGNNLFIDLATSDIVSRDTAPTLSAALNGGGKNIYNVDTMYATNFVGPLAGLVYGVDIRDINQYFQDYWDFGNIIDRTNYDSIIELLIADVDVDFGSFIGVGLKTFTVDLGSIA